MEMSRRPRRPRVTAQDFGDLYHGTAVAGLKSIDASKGDLLYTGTSRSYAFDQHNFVTNDPHTAGQYAEDATRKLQKGGNASATPVVYRVRPTKSAAFSPDPDSGPGGWRDGPRNKREALDMHENGAEVALRFNNPLKVQSEMPLHSEQFKDVLRQRSDSFRM